MQRKNVHILALTITTISGSALSLRTLQADDHEIYHDQSDEAAIRRTDLDNDGLINPLSILPDLLRTEIGGWESNAPASNPFKGDWDDADDTGLWRLNIVFSGLINPPGPIGLNGPDYDPYRY